MLTQQHGKQLSEPTERLLISPPYPTTAEELPHIIPVCG